MSKVNKVFTTYNPESHEDRQMMQILLSYPKYKKLLEFYGTSYQKEDVIKMAFDQLIDNAGEIENAFKRRNRRYT